MRVMLAALLLLFAGCADPAPANDETEADTPIPTFPQVKILESQSAGTIAMEHRGGDCITIADYDWRVNDQARKPQKSPGGDKATEFCVGYTIYLQGFDGVENRVHVVHTASSGLVFDRTLLL